MHGESTYCRQCICGMVLVPIGRVCHSASPAIVAERAKTVLRFSERKFLKNCIGGSASAPEPWPQIR